MKIKLDENLPIDLSQAAKRYQTRIDAVLRAYVQARESAAAHRREND